MAGNTDWRLRDEATPLIVPRPASAALPLEPPLRGDYSITKWQKVAIGVTSATALVGWGVASQVAKNQFNENPWIAFGADAAAGLLCCTAVKIALPNLDRPIYHYVTKYDHVIFQIASMIQQGLPQTVTQRQVWFPIIFFQMGYVVSGYLTFKATETKGNEPEFQALIEERPLIEGDTWGSPQGMWASVKPFLVKASALAIAGVAMTALGVSTGNFSLWRHGLVANGLALGLLPAQQLYMRLNQHRESFLVSPSTYIKGIPFLHNLVATGEKILPALGNIAICGAVAATINAPKAALHMDVTSALINLGTGFGLAGIDVGREDSFQHPKTVSDRNLTEKAWWVRCIEDVKRRPGDYACILGTIAAVSLFFGWNVLDPPATDATIILISTVATLALAYSVEVACPPGKNAWKNQINFRLTRSQHLVNTIFLVYLTNFYLGLLSQREETVMWVIYGVLMGMFIKPNFDEHPKDWAKPSTTYLTEGGVTANGYVRKIL